MSRTDYLKEQIAREEKELAILNNQLDKNEKELNKNNNGETIVYVQKRPTLFTDNSLVDKNISHDNSVATTNNKPNAPVVSDTNQISPQKTTDIMHRALEISNKFFDKVHSVDKVLPDSNSKSNVDFDAEPKIVGKHKQIQDSNKISVKLSQENSKKNDDLNNKENEIPKNINDNNINEFENELAGNDQDHIE